MTALLFGGVFRADLDDPKSPANDRLIFSKGHASPLFYSLYAAAGKISVDELMSLRKLGSRIEGHPTMRFPYTEAATGSLGQGLSVGLGEALAARLDGSASRVFVLLGDGELAEGSNWEAAALAAHHEAGNLIAIADINKFGQSDPTMDEHHIDVYKKKFAAFGWKVVVVDGHNFGQILRAYKTLTTTGKDQPKIIIAKTLKGKGIAGVENKPNWHGKPLPADMAEVALKKLGKIDEDLRGTVARPKSTRKTKSTTITTVVYSPYQLGAEVATRKAYGTGLVALGEADERVVALDGDVKNSTFAEMFAQKYPKRFFEMFIAEQNMVGAALGLAQRGYHPYVSTFAAFFSRAFDQIRMAAISEASMTLVGSHVGVSIGEDGSSQMGLEDLAMFRTIFGSTVLYPADAVATERLLAATRTLPGISYVRTTRMATPVIYKSTEKFPIGGSKTVRSSDSDVITIVGAGVTLFEALRAADQLKDKGINVRVIDCYSVKPIDAVTLKMAASETKAIIVVEDHWAEGGLGDAVLSALADEPKVPVYKLAVTTMPHSGKPEELLRAAGIDAEAITAAVQRVLAQK
jgi:transketolase